MPLGVLLAEAGTRLIAAQMPVDQVPYYIRWDVDSRSLLRDWRRRRDRADLRLVPAIQMTRGDVHETLKEGTRGNSIRRSLLRSGLVVVQMSFALVALVGALLFVRTFLNLDSYNVGFDTRPLMTMRFYMTGERYEPEGAKARRVEDIVRRVEGLTGVQAASRRTSFRFQAVEAAVKSRSTASRSARRRTPDFVHRSHAALSSDARRPDRSRS